MVFSVNTVIGFACAVGIDMGFNSKHHDEDEATEAVVHIHKDGKQHVHQELKKKHDHTKPRSREEAKNHRENGKGKDDCCNDKVKEFQELDKSVPCVWSLVHPIFFTAYIAIYYNGSPLPYTDVVKAVKPFVRSHHPPIPDIRTAIQSFQI